MRFAPDRGELKTAPVFNVDPSNRRTLCKRKVRTEKRFRIISTVRHTHPTEHRPLRLGLSNGTALIIAEGAVKTSRSSTEVCEHGSGLFPP